MKEQSFKKKILFEKKNVEPYSADDALAFLMDNNLTKNQYIHVRTGAKSRNANIYSTYKNVLEAKKMHK